MEATCFTPFLEPWIGKFLALKAFHKSWCPGFLRQAFHSSYKSYKAEVVRTRVQIWYPASWIVLGKLFGWYNNVDKTTSHQPPQPAWCLDFFYQSPPFRTTVSRIFRYFHPAASGQGTFYPRSCYASCVQGYTATPEQWRCGDSSMGAELGMAKRNGEMKGNSVARGWETVRVKGKHSQISYWPFRIFLHF